MGAVEAQARLLEEQSIEVGESAMVATYLIETPPGPKPEGAFVASVKKWGVIVPIIVKPSGNDKYAIVDGRRRFLAAVGTGMTMIPAQIAESEEPINNAVITLLTNEHRGRNPVAELEAIETLIHSGHTEQDIAQALNIGVGTIRKRMKLAVAPEPVRAAIKSGSLTVGTAERIAALPKSVQERVAVRIEQGDKLTQDDLRKEITVSSGSTLTQLRTALVDSPMLPPEPSPQDLIEQATRELARSAMKAGVSQRTLYALIRDEWKAAHGEPTGSQYGPESNEEAEP